MNRHPLGRHPAELLTQSVSPPRTSLRAAPARSSSGHHSDHTGPSRPVEDMAAWSLPNDGQRIPRKKGVVDPEVAAIPTIDDKIDTVRENFVKDPDSTLFKMSVNRLVYLFVQHVEDVQGSILTSRLKSFEAQHRCKQRVEKPPRPSPHPGDRKKRSVPHSCCYQQPVHVPSGSQSRGVRDFERDCSMVNGRDAVPRFRHSNSARALQKSSSASKRRTSAETTFKNRNRYPSLSQSFNKPSTSSPSNSVNGSHRVSRKRRHSRVVFDEHEVDSEVGNRGLSNSVSEVDAGMHSSHGQEGSPDLDTKFRRKLAQVEPLEKEEAHGSRLASNNVPFHRQNGLLSDDASEEFVSSQEEELQRKYTVRPKMMVPPFDRVLVSDYASLTPVIDESDDDTSAEEERRARSRYSTIARYLQEHGYAEDSTELVNTQSTGEASCQEPPISHLEGTDVFSQVAVTDPSPLTTQNAAVVHTDANVTCEGERDAKDFEKSKESGKKDITKRQIEQQVTVGSCSTDRVQETNPKTIQGKDSLPTSGFPKTDLVSSRCKPASAVEVSAKGVESELTQRSDQVFEHEQSRILENVAKSMETKCVTPVRPTLTTRLISTRNFESATEAEVRAASTGGAEPLAEKKSVHPSDSTSNTTTPHDSEPTSNAAGGAEPGSSLLQTFEPESTAKPAISSSQLAASNNLTSALSPVPGDTLLPQSAYTHGTALCHELRTVKDVTFLFDTVSSGVNTAITPDVVPDPEVAPASGVELDLEVLPDPGAIPNHHVEFALDGAVPSEVSPPPDLAVSPGLGPSHEIAKSCEKGAQTAEVTFPPGTVSEPNKDEGAKAESHPAMAHVSLACRSPSQLYSGHSPNSLGDTSYVKFGSDAISVPISEAQLEHFSGPNAKLVTSMPDSARIQQGASNAGPSLLPSSASTCKDTPEKEQLSAPSTSVAPKTFVTRNAEFEQPISHSSIADAPQDIFTIVPSASAPTRTTALDSIPTASTEPLAAQFLCGKQHPISSSKMALDQERELHLQSDPAGDCLQEQNPTPFTCDEALDPPTTKWHIIGSPPDVSAYEYDVRKRLMRDCMVPPTVGNVSMSFFPLGDVTQNLSTEEFIKQANGLVAGAPGILVEDESGATYYQGATEICSPVGSPAPTERQERNHGSRKRRRSPSPRHRNVAHKIVSHPKDGNGRILNCGSRTPSANEMMRENDNVLRTTHHQGRKIDLNSSDSMHSVPTVTNGYMRDLEIQDSENILCKPDNVLDVHVTQPVKFPVAIVHPSENRNTNVDDDANHKNEQILASERAPEVDGFDIEQSRRSDIDMQGNSKKVWGSTPSDGNTLSNGKKRAYNSANRPVGVREKNGNGIRIPGWETSDGSTRTEERLSNCEEEIDVTRGAKEAVTDLETVCAAKYGSFEWTNANFENSLGVWSTDRTQNVNALNGSDVGTFSRIRGVRNDLYRLGFGCDPSLKEYGEFHVGRSTALNPGVPHGKQMPGNARASSSGDYEVNRPLLIEGSVGSENQTMRLDKQSARRSSSWRKDPCTTKIQSCDVENGEVQAGRASDQMRDSEGFPSSSDGSVLYPATRSEIRGGTVMHSSTNNALDSEFGDVVSAANPDCAFGMFLGPTDDSVVGSSGIGLDGTSGFKSEAPQDRGEIDSDCIDGLHSWR